MKTTSIRIGMVQSAASRLDAPFFLNDAVAYFDGLKKCPYEVATVGESCQRIFFGNIFSRCFVKDADHGVPYLRASEIQKADLDGGGLYLAKRQADALAYLRLKKGWILVTCSGSLGNCVYADARFEKYIGTHDLIRIVPGAAKMLPGALFAFLACKFGYAALTHSQYGSVILHTNPDQVGGIPIPVFPETFQREVHAKIVESARLREEADAALKRAVGLFEREAGCGGRGIGRRWNAVPTDADRVGSALRADRAGVVTLGRITDKSRRFDAHYQLGTQRLDGEMATCPLEQVSLASVAKRMFVGGRGKRNYVKNGIPFLSSSDMMLFNAIRESKPISRTNPGLDSLLVHENDILISRSGTVGNVMIVGHDLDGAAVSEHALRLVVDAAKISPAYVFCFLKTQWAKAYMEASAYGSVIITLNEAFIGAMTMPVFKGRVYDSIVRDIEEYKTKLATAADLENAAIDMVEREIESWQG